MPIRYLSFYVRHIFTRYFNVADIFRVEEEKQPNYIFTHVPPYSDASDILGLHEILPWRTWYFYWTHQLLRPYYYVFVLSPISIRSAVPEVFMVEKIYNYAPACKFQLMNVKGVPKEVENLKPTSGKPHLRDSEVNQKLVIRIEKSSNYEVYIANQLTI